MTVKQLIKKLSKCDSEATVIIENTEIPFNAYYTVTNVDTDEIFVLIGSDYKRRVVAPWKGEEE